MRIFDLSRSSLRELNQALHDLGEADCGAPIHIYESRGAHAIACGMKVPATIEIHGHAGYYCAGMNQRAEVTVHGNAGPGVAENMMSGRVWVKGHASQSAGATAHGGLLVIEGHASARCGISLKGGDIVVKGSVGHLSGFMAQAGRLVICGDAGGALGDSLYEARIYVRGKVESTGADCMEKEMEPGHLKELGELLAAAESAAEPGEFRRYGSARALYNFHVDHASSY